MCCRVWFQQRQRSIPWRKRHQAQNTVGAYSILRAAHSTKISCPQWKSSRWSSQDCRHQYIQNSQVIHLPLMIIIGSKLHSTARLGKKDLKIRLLGEIQMKNRSFLKNNGLIFKSYTSCYSESSSNHKLMSDTSKYTSHKNSFKR